MDLRKLFRPSRRPITLLLGVLAGLCAVPGAAPGQGKPKNLLIGTSGTLTGNEKEGKEESALKTLKAFIKDETGLDNTIERQKDWNDLVEKMSKGKLHLGVFQGFEFAHAQKKNAELKPLALAINVYRYPVAYVVANKSSKAKDFAGLKGASLSIPTGSQGFLKLFVRTKAGKSVKDFFSKVDTKQTVEDAIDDVVDGKVGAVVVDKAGLEAYKRRKPARFKKLKPVAKSDPFPPTVVAYYGKHLPETERRRFLKGLLAASTKEKGRMMLTLFRVTGFVTVPADFKKVVAATEKAYPAGKATE